jgi:hypothetical protein
MSGGAMQDSGEEMFVKNPPIFCRCRDYNDTINSMSRKKYHFRNFFVIIFSANILTVVLD